MRLGVLIGVSGGTAGVGAKIDRWSNEGPLVLTLNGDDVTDWINSADRVDWLKRRIQSAALRACSIPSPRRA